MSSVSAFLTSYVRALADRRWTHGEPVKEGLHISGVVVSPCDKAGSQTVIITADGVDFIDGVKIERGVHVAIAFTSEHGDSFIREFHFHKGNVYTQDVDASDALDIRQDFPLDIWRD